jgi:hypothetical protein
MVSLNFWILTSAIVAGLLLIQFVLNSYLIYSRVSHPLHVLWTEFDVDMRQHFPNLHFSDLEKLGFSLAGYLVKSDFSGGGLFHLAIFIHSQNKDSAEVFVSNSGRSLFALPIFKSRFQDGFAFEVGNHGIAPHKISGGPNFPAFNFPQVQSTAELYRIHCLAKKHFSKSRVPVVAEGSGELSEFARKAEEVHQYTMSRPGYKLNSDGTCYAYTAPGAVRAALRHQWPITSIRRWSALVSARRHARKLESTAGEA